MVSTIFGVSQPWYVITKKKNWIGARVKNEWDLGLGQCDITELNTVVWLH